MESEYTTYHRSSKALGTLLEQPHSLALVRCAVDYGRDAALSHVLQDGLKLVGSGRVFGDVQLELGTLGSRLRRVVAGLVLGSMFGGVGRRLLQEGGDAHRGRRAGLVEEGDDVFGFVLHAVAISDYSGREEDRRSGTVGWTYKAKHGGGLAIVGGCW